MYKDSDSLEVKASLHKRGFAEEGFNKEPALVQFPGKVQDVVTCDSVNAAILENGQLFTWGEFIYEDTLLVPHSPVPFLTSGLGNSGQLARSEGMTTPDENGNYDLSPTGFGYVRIDDDKSYDLQVIAEHFLTPKEVLWDTRFIRRRVLAVSVGALHIVASATGPEGHGQVFTSGHNSSGQLGHGDLICRHQMTKAS